MFTFLLCAIAFAAGAFAESEFALTRRFEAWLYKVLDR